MLCVTDSFQKAIYASLSSPDLLVMQSDSQDHLTP